jgi:HD-GYP domain-containing protein (c-di-GMP phosphodiesterase class II)
MTGSDMDARGQEEEAGVLEPVEEERVADLVERQVFDSPEFHAWKESYLTERVPSLFMDGSMKILQANERFCRLYGFDPRFLGQHFTQFYSPYFDEHRSSELFRAIRSPAAGFSWHGRVEKLGTDQLLNVSKVWIVPIGLSVRTSMVNDPAGARQAGAEDAPADSPALPGAYTAVCLDMTAEHRQLLQSTFTSLLGAARLKDNDTGNHIERVNRYARILAERLLGREGAPLVDREFVASISQVAALHDVGKIGTPDDILNKAGKLDPWEWEVMKQHSTNGAFILATYPSPMAGEIALRHHERWDGSGYPHGLSGDSIPLSARIVAVADVYDALRMRRTYKVAYTHEQTVETMKAESGSHFDPYLIERFLDDAEAFRAIFTELADPAP